MDADAEQAMLELLASPLVDQVKPLSSATGGFYATLWCRNHADHPRRNSEQCQYTRTRTTPAQCLRDLLTLVNKNHSSHLAAAEAAKAQAVAEAAAAAGPSAPTTAFAAIGAAWHVQPAAEKARAAEQAASKAHNAKRAAEKALNEAAAAAAVAEAEARRLQVEADDARQAAGLVRKKARVEEEDADPTSRSRVYNCGHRARECVARP